MYYNQKTVFWSTEITIKTKDLVFYACCGVYTTPIWLEFWA
jgi:hypothetical protein